MPYIVNEGSACRDFCMLERNILAHLKLGLLLALLSFSLLLHTKLVDDDQDSSGTADSSPRSRLIVATIQVIAAFASIAAGVWEYHSGCKDLLTMRAFLVNERSHFTIVTGISVVVLVTCFVLLSDASVV